MFRCSDVSQLVSRSMDAPLPLYLRLGVRAHLMICRYCSLFRRQLFVLRKLSRDSDGHLPEGQSRIRLTHEAKARMKENLRSAS